MGQEEREMASAMFSLVLYDIVICEALDLIAVSDGVVAAAKVTFYMWRRVKEILSFAMRRNVLFFLFFSLSVLLFFFFACAVELSYI
jgi:hypothetical protein